jgi:hypothetical protein
MNPGCDSMKNRRSAARVAAIYADQTSVSNEVCPFNILSINRVHEVTGHFFASVFDRNGDMIDATPLFDDDLKNPVHSADYGALVMSSIKRNRMVYFHKDGCQRKSLSFPLS